MSNETLPALHITDPEQLRLLLAESYRHNEQLQKALDEQRIRRFWSFGDEEHWLWDSEGNNYLDSLVCPIVISANDMRAIRDAARKLDACVEITNDFWDTADLIRRSEAVREARLDFEKCFNDDTEAA
ncbi:hypothetical protein [Shewanella algae]|uniref:hypothetical protein n=1 Tax=Shewanella algae TaxID=38313 RepID=UPI001021331D